MATKNNAQLLSWATNSSRTTAELTACYTGTPALASVTPVPTGRTELLRAIVQHYNSLPPCDEAAYQPPTNPSRPRPNTTTTTSMTITGLPLPAATEGVVYNHTLSAAGSGTREWKLTAAPAWMTIGKNNGRLTGTPPVNSRGTSNVSVEVSDGTNTANASTSVTVNAGTAPATLPRDNSNTWKTLGIIGLILGLLSLCCIGTIIVALLLGNVHLPVINIGGDKDPGTTPVVIGNGNLDLAYQAGPVGSNAFCKALSGVVGGPEYKWWGTQNPDGTSVANSCVMREVDDTDGVLGYEFNLPAGTVWHIWLVDPSKPNIHVAVTAVGPGKIQSPFLVSRATGYFGTNVTFGGHSGEWIYEIWEGSSNPVGTWTKIGTTPIVTAAVKPAASGTCNNIAALKAALSAKGNIVTETADYLVVDLSAEFVVPAGVVAQWTGNPSNSTPSDGSVRVPPGRVTLYPTCK